MARIMLGIYLVWLVLTPIALYAVEQSSLDTDRYSLEHSTEQLPLADVTYPWEHLLKGRAIYEHRCAKCHDSGEGGAPHLGRAVDWVKRVPEWRSLASDHAKKGFLMMPPKGGDPELSDEDLSAAMDYLILARIPPRYPLLSDAITKGREVYHFNCAKCHDHGKDGAPAIGNSAEWESRSPHWLTVLVQHSEQGYLRMPSKGGNLDLNREDLKAAIIYMLSWSQAYPPTQPPLPRR